MLIDSHCHLNFPDFTEDIDEVLARAREAGVGCMQTICTKMSEYDDIKAISDAHEDIYCSVGVHPNNAKDEPLVESAELVEKCTHPKTIGIGETGLDYYYEHSDRALQQDSFKRHISAAQQTQLPIIVHTRDAEEDTIQIVTESFSDASYKGLIHCFTSTKQLAEKMLDIGFYISFSGIITFKNASDLREIAAYVPLNRILIETDAPYLAPMPNRGKRNEPSFVQYTNKMIAELKGISEAECAQATTENFYRLFEKAVT